MRRNLNQAAAGWVCATVERETKAHRAVRHPGRPATANSVSRRRPSPNIDERSPVRSSNCGRSGPGAIPSQTAENFFYFSHRQLSLGQSAPSTFQWRRLAARRCPAPPRLHEVLFRKSFRACEYRFRAPQFFYPFQPGIHIHIASESVFTSLRNDYSHAPESAPK